VCVFACGSVRVSMSLSLFVCVCVCERESGCVHARSFVRVCVCV